MSDAYWTEDRIATLTRLSRDGLSGSQIANELGGQVTRSAVIAKAHRLGLTGTKQVDTRTGRNRSVEAGAKRDSMGQPIGRTKTFYPKQAKPARQSVSRIDKHGKSVDVLAPLPLPDEPNIEIPVGQRCTLFDLSDAKCRWPVGDPGTPGFFFCGGAPVDNLPYCTYHAAVAYVPPSTRTRTIGR